MNRNLGNISTIIQIISTLVLLLHPKQGIKGKGNVPEKEQQDMRSSTLHSTLVMERKVELAIKMAKMQAAAVLGCS